ncbi:MAG: Ribosome-binding factor A [Alphaproteobacteria bacterium MarineAlpha2_Bin1]|mgnify:CR=1 FL=1|nr:MAG: Ribosome-binding factor A [Alphaproteobacteria bacterium MarineAlpha2_Bin1]|tara:strand:- start:48 stop:428 length:381 start_codon:yes stop_codon:yes gene_type:complete
MRKSLSKLPTNRQLKVGELLRHKISEELIRNPFFDNKYSNIPLTVTEVKMTSDLKKAMVFIVPLIGEDSDSIFDKLNIIAPKIQGKIGRSLGLRFTPEIIFKKDFTFEKMDKIEKLLTKLKKNKKE